MKGDDNPIDPIERLRNAPRCTATAKSTGMRCKCPAVRGWTVCRVHGAGGGALRGVAHPTSNMVYERLRWRKYGVLSRFFAGNVKLNLGCSFMTRHSMAAFGPNPTFVLFAANVGFESNVTIAPLCRQGRLCGSHFSTSKSNLFFFSTAIRHYLAQLAAYASHMDENERYQRHIIKRKMAATPATRRVFGFSAICNLASFTVCAFAIFHHNFTAYGIHTHPPNWLFVIAHFIAFLGALASGYFFLYVSPSQRWRAGAVGAGLCYVFTLAAIAWGLPNLAVSIGAQPVRVEAEIYGGSNYQGRKGFGCRAKVTFGPWYAPGGSACYNIRQPGLIAGHTMIMRGYGNSWATRITRIERVYKH